MWWCLAGGDKAMILEALYVPAMLELRHWYWKAGWWI